MVTDQKHPRIFVQIASYRDPECHHTIRDLFEKAAHPERVFVGVCWQYDPESDAEFIHVPYPRHEQVQVIQYHAKDAQGAGWARMQAQTLYRGEEYILQIQAHHRFEPGWDDTLIALLAKCSSEKPVLTAWLPGYTPPDNKPDLHGMLPLSVVNYVGKEGDVQMVHLIKRMRPAESLLDKTLPTPIWVGNFMFTRAETIKEVPFDPYIYFWGEEINYSARLYTHGYDIFHLDRLVAYHYWDRAGVKDESMYRAYANERNQRSLERNLHLFGLKTAQDAGALADIEKYPLGMARSLESFWRYLGVNPVDKTLTRKAHEGAWTMEDLKPANKAQANRARIFVASAAYRDPEISATLADMFAKAKYPGRIAAGICLQYDPTEDAGCDVRSDRMGQIRLREVNYKDSHGANWARHVALGLRKDEEYVLQIDSHMRFEPGWDETLIDMLSRCPSDKPVISAYLPNYNPPDTRDYTPGNLLRIRVRKFGGPQDPQLIHVTGQFVPFAEKERMGLYPTPLFIANFMFTKAKTLDEVPVDPHFHFYGDEISYSARLWTHGYDVFQPDRIVMFHYWVRSQTLHLQHYRNTRTPRSKLSLLRVRHLLDLDQSHDPQALVDIEKYGLGKERALEDLWAFAGIDLSKKTVTQAAQEGKWDMAARKKALEKKQKKMPRKTAKSAGEMRKAGQKHPRIFVQVAAYRDPDCQHTIKDLFEKAAHPERIFVGICWQTVKGEDDICFQVPYPRPDQVRVTEVDARESRGVCWARGLVQKLWQGEEFTLQIDSHMRFEPGWDDTLLAMWEDCHNEKAVLTCYPPGFTPNGKFERNFIFGMSAKEFDKNGIFLMKGAPAYRQGQFPEHPVPGAFLSGCMFFGPSSIIEDVPYDPHLYFFGEEITMGVRLWTHGYDMYHPNKMFIFHDWDRSKRPTHFSDHKDWGKFNEISFMRTRHLLGTETSMRPEVLEELDKYGLGTVRTLAQYQEYSGVDFASRSFNDRAAKCDFSAPLARPEVKSGKGGRPRIFVQIASYRDPECQWTVKDLFEKAKYPDRISVGICWQFDAEEDKHCFEVSSHPDQVRILPVDWRESEGVCWARNMTQQLWDGEEYSLQIDSHMRFMNGWDELLISELEACESKKPVLSCSPAAYTPPNNLEEYPRPTIRRVMPFFPDGNIRGKGEALDSVPLKPLNGAFIAAGFVFARAEILKEVPYDPYLYFDQEEITYAARLYTHGWDIFSTRRPMLYHYYNIGGRDTRPMHWNDLKQHDGSKISFLRERGLSRFNHMTGYRASQDLEAIKELSNYDFGRVRTLAQYETYSGVDFKRKIASEKALRCLFIHDLAKYRSTPIRVPELDGDAQPQKPALLRPQAQAMYSAILEPGDFVPMFRLTDTNHKLNSVETRGGRIGGLIFLPANNPEYISNFIRELDKRLDAGRKMELWFIFILDDTIENLLRLKEKTKLSHVFTADPDRVVARAFGITRPGDLATPPAAFAINANLKIISRHSNMSAAQLADALVRECRVLCDQRESKQHEARVISQAPPMLIVPNAFSKDLCERAIAAFRTGYTFKGTVGGDKEGGYVPQAKTRMDYVVHGELQREIDDKLSRSLFPEIKKVFGFDVTHRETYKIGLYDGRQGGFFKQHRDNFDEPMGYRRIACTVHLNDDYEGGGLRFPEYDENIYRPDAGSAAAFSCASMHEARQVTSGERFVLVAFFHGAKEEAFRRYYQMQKGGALRIEDFTPELHEFPKDLNVSRAFFDDWQAQHIRYDNPLAAGQSAQTTGNTTGTTLMTVKPSTPNLTTGSGKHVPKKVFESKQAIVFDDFLPEDIYERIHAFCTKTDYEYINTKGKVSRAWHINDGFPLRSTLNEFYYPEGIEKPKGDYVYPTKTDMDQFIDALLGIQPEVEHLLGKQGKDWAHVSATAWIYPHGTSLALHDDGSGVYTGAFAYFLNPTWKLHWGGLLLLMEEEANQKIYDHRNKVDQIDFYKRKWLNANATDELLMEHGFAKCIFPKRNRIVFIANDAYHMVTRVNEAAGDNHRMSIAGFFNRKK